MGKCLTSKGLTWGLVLSLIGLFILKLSEAQELQFLIDICGIGLIIFGNTLLSASLTYRVYKKIISIH